MKKLIVFILIFAFSFVGFSNTSDASARQLIIINKDNNQLAYYENDKLVRVFIVATGKKASYTPEGKFKVVTKIVNRPYYKGNIRGGDPKNPLGKRWLGINARNTPGNTYAIHGNNDPTTIGKYISAGCIRMYNNDVQWLYDRVNMNTVVLIASSNKSFATIAATNGYKVSGSVSLPVNTNASLKKGSSGPQVIELQKRLTKLGYSTKGVDGAFGKNTEAAVMKFQKSKKLNSDGVVGPKTKKALGLK
ncbi:MULTISPECIES: L,D-transpeptidase family protein [Peribacillus]|uniref:L,D-transpeptidase YkuD n=1 Tax=Peribacillus simplex TaxID=1478 RepID=A0A9W4PGJ0_9BACI|nr:L,D-transpeptidase family protein [Peribacillus simplex]MDR4926281.1 L,D-transpeptidase family protein [Peribacillus simplex]WHX89100.1 L,D-transpeptidase family protein [Peribacillus simplex]CAH0222510.1 Putative L,D-transpeptidase YkuD [Peribacillus simplex]